MCRDYDASFPHSASQSSISVAHSGVNLAGAADENGGSTTPKSGTPAAGTSLDNSSGGAAAAGAGDALSKKRAYKEKWQEGVALFNTKPKKGIALLQVRVGSSGCAAGWCDIWLNCLCLT